MLLNKVDEYYSTNSFIHKMNAVVKLICFIIFLIIISSNDLLVNLVLIDLLVLLIFLSKVPLCIYLEFVIRIRYFILGIFIITLLLSFDFVISIVLIIKLILIIWYLLLITLTTSPSEITYSLEKLLYPFKWIKIPIKKLSLEMSLILRFIPMMFNEFDLVLKQFKNKGIFNSKLDYFKAILPTFRLTLAKIKKIKTSMEFKMFDIGKRRTNYRFNKIGIFDIIILVVHMGLLVLMIGCEV